MTHTTPTNIEETTWEERFEELPIKENIVIDMGGEPDFYPLKEVVRDFIRKELQLAQEHGERKGRWNAVNELRRGPAHVSGSDKAYKEIDVDVLVKVAGTPPEETNGKTV